MLIFSFNKVGVVSPMSSFDDQSVELQRLAMDAVFFFLFVLCFDRAISGHRNSSVVDIWNEFRRRIIREFDRELERRRAELSLRHDDIWRGRSRRSTHSASTWESLHRPQHPDDLGQVENFTVQSSITLPTEVNLFALAKIGGRRTEEYVIFTAVTQSEDSIISARSIETPVYKWSSNQKQLEFASTIKGPSSVRIEVFYMKGSPFMVHAINNYWFTDYQLHPTPIYRITSRRQLKIVQHIPAVGACKWEHFRLDDDHFLIQASYIGHRKGSESRFGYGRRRTVVTGSTKLRFFVWYHGHFQETSSFIRVTHVTDVETHFIRDQMFLAVSTQMDLKRNLKSKISLYRLESLKNGMLPEVKYELIQEMVLDSTTTTTGPRDLEFVTSGSETFLAVATGFSTSKPDKHQLPEVSDSILYRWNGLNLVKFQTVSIGKPLRWFSAYGPEKQTVLFLQTDDSTRRFQFYDGKWQDMEEVERAEVGVVRLRIASKVVAVFQTGKTSYVLEMDDAGSMSISLMEYGGSNFLVATTRRNVAKCRDVAKRIDSMEVGKLARVPSPRNLEINGSTTVERIVVNGTLVMTKGSRFNGIDVGSIRDGWIVRLGRHEMLIDRLRANLTDPYLLNKSGRQLLKGTLIVDGATTRVETLIASSSIVSYVNGINFTHFSLNSVHKTGNGNNPPIIGSNIGFQKLIVDELSVGDLKINNLDLVRRDHRPVVFTSNKYFNVPVGITAKLTVTGSIDGVPVDSILSTRKRKNSRKFDGVCDFERVFVSGHLFQGSSRTINGLSWKHMVENIPSVHKGFVLAGRREFEGLEIFGSISGGDRTMDVNGMTARQYGTVILQNGGDFSFGDDVKVTRLTSRHVDVVSGRLNDLNIFEDVVTTSDRKWGLDVQFDKLIVRDLMANKINDVPVDEFVLKNDTRVITGRKIFGSASVGRQSFVNGPVQDLDLAQFSAMHTGAALTVRRRQSITRTRSLRIDPGSIPENLERIINDAVKIDEDVSFRSSVKYSGNVRLASGITSSAGTVYNLVPVATSSDGIVTIHGNVTFDEIRLESDSTIVGRLNSVRVPNLLRDAIFLNGTQTLSASKRFKDPIRIRGPCWIDGRINGIRTAAMFNANLGSENASVNVNGVCEFRGHSKVIDLNVADSLNGRVIDDLFDDTVSRSRGSRIRGRKYFGDLRARVLNVGSIDGIDVTEIAGRAAFLDSPIVFEGPVNFYSDVEIDYLALTGRIDDVNVTHLLMKTTKEDLKNLSVLTTNSAAIVGVKYLKTPFVNGFDLSGLCEIAVSRNEPELPKNLRFSDVLVEGSVNAQGTIAGLELGSDVVNKLDKSEILVSGKKYFTGSVHLGSDVTVTGLINDIDVIKLSDEVVTDYGSQSITGSVTFGHSVVHFENDLIVNDDLCGVSQVRFFTKMLRLDSQSNHPVKLHFASVSFTSDVRVTTFNGLNLTTFNDRLLTLNTSQNIVTSLKMTGNVRFRSFDAKTVRMREKAKLNGYDVDVWAKDVLTKNNFDRISGRYVFEGNVTFEKDLRVVGKIDGTLTADFVVLSSVGEYDLYGNYNFVDIITTNNLKSTGDVGGVDVDDWYERFVWSSKSRQVIDGNLNLTSSLDVLGNVSVRNRVDGMKTDDLLTKRFDGMITGYKIFRNIKFEANKKVLYIEGKVNDIPWSVRKIFRKLIRQPFDNKSRLKIDKVLDGKIRLSNVRSKNEILAHVYRTEERATSKAQRIAAKITSTLDTMCSAIGHIDNVFQNSYSRPITYRSSNTMEFDRFKQTISCTLKGDLPAIVSWDHKSLDVILFKSFHNKGEDFDHVKDVTYKYDKMQGLATSVICFDVNSTAYLTAAIMTSNSPCSNTLQVFKFSEEDGIEEDHRVEVEGCVTMMDAMKVSDESVIFVAARGIQDRNVYAVHSFIFGRNLSILPNSVRFDRLVNMKVVGNNQTLVVLNMDTQFSHYVTFMLWNPQNRRLLQYKSIEAIVGRNQFDQLLYGVEAVGVDGADIAFVIPRQTYAGSYYDSVWAEILSPDGEIKMQPISLSRLIGIWFISYGGENVLVLRNDVTVSFYRYNRASSFVLFRTVKLANFDDIDSFGSARYGYFIGLWKTSYVSKKLELYIGFREGGLIARSQSCHETCP